MIAVSEVFYSLQGEGKTSGYPAVFIRLGGCNLMCGGNGTQFDNELHNDATWRCDTIEVWMNAQKKRYDEVLDDICIEAIKNGANVVITGGEPMLQQSAICELILYIKTEINPNAFIEVETNGTIVPKQSTTELINQWNVSPKLANSGNDKSIRYNDTALLVYNTLNTQFKFVVGDYEDYAEIENDFHFLDANKIYLMPAGSSIDELQHSKIVVADLCKNHYLKMTDRLHIAIWNKKTGV